MKLDTKSAFFGFLIGFCVYLFISHVILDIVFGNVSSNNNQKVYINTNNIGIASLSIVPWSFALNVENIANSNRFKGEKEKPPRRIEEAKKDKISEQRNKHQFYGGSDVDESMLID